jgi:hypothetical protein
MGSVCASNDLFDVISNFHGDSAEIPTYARGTKRLDYAVASASLRQLICACGYNLFNEHIHLDHRASFVDLRLKDFFGHITPTLSSPDLRFVSSASPAVTQFVPKMHSHLSENKVFHSYQEFRLDRDVLAEPSRITNKIDSLVGQAFQVAETSCYNPPKPPWSEKLHIASLKVRFWKTALTERLTKVPQSAVLHNVSAEIWQSVPPTMPDDFFVETKMVMELLQERQRDLGTKWSEVVSFDEFISGLLHWNKSTSTSPSGRQLGLYKALVISYCNLIGEFNTIPEDDDSELTTQEMAKQILELIHGLAAETARQGFYLQQWIHVINIMIYKKPG